MRFSVTHFSKQREKVIWTNKTLFTKKNENKDVYKQIQVLLLHAVPYFAKQGT